MKTVIFDMDGVIIDSERIVENAWKIVGPKYGMTDIEKVYARTIGTNKAATADIIKEAYGDDFDVVAFFNDTRKAFYEYIESNGLPKKKGIDEILAYLKENGYKIGLASSTRLSSVKEEMRLIGLIDYFDCIIGGDMVKMSKPDPEIFVKCMNALGAVHEETYVIEDSYNGIRAAHAAGMKPVMVPDMLMPDDEMKKLSFAIKDDLYSVMEMLKALDRNQDN